ncbi:MAG: CBS domain-containing protein [Peptococcaceae bacterium]|nr:CBS domain-containing protein [Peptococcaceae bacterium]
MEKVIRLLKSIVPFRSLDEAVLREVGTEMYFKEFPAGVYVFRQGDPSQNLLYIVIEGTAEVTVRSGRGMETVVGYRRKNDFFGETVVLTDQKYPGSVRAKEDLTCLVVPRKIFERLMHHYPDVADFFSRVLLDRMRTLYEEIVAEQAHAVHGRGAEALFRRRVKELMSSPVITCRLGDPVSRVARVMADRNISAVIVVDGDGRPVGIVTERDLVAELIARPVKKVEECRVETVMKPELVTIAASVYLHEALLKMIKYGVKHLAVMEDGRLAGIISVVDLVKARGTGTFWVAHRIESQQTIAGLSEVGREVDNFLNALVAEKAGAREIMDIMSELNDALTRRVIALCEQEMRERYGPPPVDYCWVTMGSAGRREQTLRTDQDNAIIYDDPEDAETVEAADYFHRLGIKITDALVRCGFAECPGGVMSAYPEWCQSLAQWKERVQRWIFRGEPEDVRMLTILLDFRLVYGTETLAEKLWRAVFQTLKARGGAPHFMAGDDVHLRPPLSLFGGFVTERSGKHKNQINLKTAACLPIVNCVRIFALKYGLTETSTLGRLRLLAGMGAMPRDDIEFIEAAYETLMMFRIRSNLAKLDRNETPDDYINPFELSKREQAVLKDAFSVIPRLQKRTAGEFGEFWRLYLPS